MDYQDGRLGFNTDPGRGADTFTPFLSLNLSNAEIAYLYAMNSSTYNSTFSVGGLIYNNQGNMVTLNKMNVYPSYFAYDDNRYGKYEGKYWEYTSAGYIVKQAGYFYVYSNSVVCPHNEIKYYNAGDIIAILDTRGAPTNHINLVIAL